MSAFHRKRTAGRCSLNARAARKRRLAKISGHRKNCGHRKSHFFGFFKTGLLGVPGGLYAVFRIGPVEEICFCFFHAAYWAVRGRAPGRRSHRRGTGVVITGLSLTLSPYFLSAFVTRFPNALSERPISRFSSFKVLDLAPPFFLRTVVFIANSSSARSGAIVIAHLLPALHCGFLISYPFARG